MDITVATIAGVLILGGLYFYLRSRREGKFLPGKKRTPAKTSNIRGMSGQFSSSEWGEFEGARSHS